MHRYIKKAIFLLIAAVASLCVFYSASAKTQWEYFSGIKHGSFYSQLGEDVILSIVFSDRLHKNAGIYVDVGANHPTINNVTKLFYDFGWSGVNVEPITILYNDLVKERPRDININKVISDKSGFVTFYEVNGRDVLSSTQLDAVKRFKGGLKEYEVEALALNDLFKEHNIKNITFLSIDVEGSEKDVLQTIDLSKYRPEVILVEALDPTTLRPSHQLWEDILINNRYQFVYFDGLNRYYVRNESAALLKERFALADRIMKTIYASNK